MFGIDNVTDTKPTMGGEDFAFYTEKVPGAMIFMGHGNPETNFPLHNPNFQIDDSVLPRGARLLAELALEYLDRGGFEKPVESETDSASGGSACKAGGSGSAAGQYCSNPV